MTLMSRLTGIWHIAPLGDYPMALEFELMVATKPKLDNKAKYKIKDDGDAELSTHSHHLSGGLKRIGRDSYEANVVWGMGNEEESR